MSQFSITGYSNSDKIAQHLLENIKLFHVFDDNIGTNLVFVTNNDIVYGLGANQYGSLGLGHNQQVDEPVCVPELSGQRVQHFTNGSSFAMAITGDHQVYSWGHNDWGQLARKRTANHQHLKPEKIMFPNNETINQLSCGQFHTLALTTRGTVYAWGNNCDGQLGCGMPMTRSSISDRPALVCFKPGTYIVDVYASKFCSFAITSEARVYSWGQNSYHQLGHKDKQSLAKPKLVHKLKRVQRVCHSWSTCVSYFLTISGQLYCCGIFKEASNHKLIDNHFVDIVKLGEGAFGQVFKARQKSDNCLFAIKTIYMDDLSDETKQKALKEAKGLANVKSKYVVDYWNSWIEDNHLYIQMEYCTTTLNDLLQIRSNIFNRSSDQPMDSLEFYMSCELFKEVLECVHYIQQQDIIHRDLKPENILVVDITYQLHIRYLRLGDFGLAIETNSPHKTSGSPQYIAPEVSRGVKNTKKSDIYSVGCIGQKLFDINLTDSKRIEKYQNHKLYKYVEKLDKYLSKMVDQLPRKRPDLATVLNKHGKWMPEMSMLLMTVSAN
ncbi:developmentally-regulated protein kinase 1-like [Oppia nitens]|uniref:developmentally-regulated protein kinase 1-like n=1 Tax=Oppia nitens TaxID=1686743 RepID=UPI0023DBD3F6|nr:developmentally-regulated protein kinase 1-like [Oppia nitens]